MSRTCPKCFSADEVTQRRGFEGLWTFVCANAAKHDPPGPYSWDDTNEAEGGADGVRQALAPYMGPLLASVKPGEPYVEYGIVEWRFRAIAPALFEELVREHGHRELNKIETPKSTSAYLAMALGLLAADDQLVRIEGKATGAWDYNGTVRYWAVPPGPPMTSRMTWEEFALAEGLDPRDLRS
jgi:hypothetical protein